mmetsp:Transcript_49720/g.97504  ORF Transcript_49720/g.97504 Transcript_49720/m.97504 type:complete len:116 (+) Transcript_49720:241-588(+)
MTSVVECSDNLSEMVQFIQSMHIFRDWSQEQAIKFAVCLHRRQVAANKPFFKQHDMAHYVYFVLEGEVLVKWKSDGKRNFWDKVELDAIEQLEEEKKRRNGQLPRSASPFGCITE